MAKETLIRLSDDLDGGDAVEELTFALRGVEYEIDLSAKNVAALEKALDKYVTAGRRSRPVRSPRTRTARAAGSVARQDTAAVREWARGAGYEVSTRGRIPVEIKDAYEAAQS